MTLVNVRFVPSHKPKGRSPGFGTLGQFMVSDQIGRPLVRAAVDMVAVMKALAPRSDDPRRPERGPHYADRFSIQAGPLVTMVYDSRARKNNPHRMVQISNDADDAIAIELGSGIKSAGTTKGAERRQKQGGWNKPMRVMGRGGRLIGRAAEED